ncbi:MAG: nitrilase family protein [Ferruginibacter sp.]
MSTLTVTLIQTDLHWEDRAANLAMLEEKINSISTHTEIVVLPEMFSTGFSMQPGLFAETMEGETVAWMKRIAAAKKIILTGSLMIKTGQATSGVAETGQATSGVVETGQATASGQTSFYNRLIWMLPNGEYGIYDKRHLFAYGEEDQHYSAGNKRLIASVKGWKINLLICYDLRFPVWARQQSTDVPEYDVLIYVANWPQRRNHAWKTLLQARAIENQSYVIGVNRTGDDGKNIHYHGDSMVIDPLGEVLYHKEADEDIFTISLQKDKLDDVRSRLPFWKDGDEFKLTGNTE